MDCVLNDDTKIFLIWKENMFMSSKIYCIINEADESRPKATNEIDFFFLWQW